MNILDIFFPKRCVGCGKIGTYFCQRCRGGVKTIAANESICPVCGRLAIDGITHPHCVSRYTPDRLISFFRYDGVVKKAIKIIKYRFVSDLAGEFVHLIPNFSLCQVTKQLSNHATIIPIPLHISRFRFRGFNQAEKLGNILARELHIPVQTDILRRKKETHPQVEMKHRKDRLQNMDGVFALQRTINPGLTGKNDEPQTIILFDDVFTTGATMRAATNVLKRAGVKSVWCVTMAR